MPPKKPAAKKTVEALKHDEATRKNIPTAEYQSVLQKNEQEPVKVSYPRNRDLDPQLVWRGKDEQDWSDLVVHAQPLYIQEKVHPKVLIDDLLNRTKADDKASEPQLDLFGDFNGIPKGADKTEFYQHDQNWSNRMILGDSLQVMASLAEREGLRGKVQCIYFDPPYGIKFNSNFQWSTTSRDVKDGATSHITREPEQVKAFRDTWRDGIHSYLTYLRDRLTVARDLLTDSGSIFVQIGDENVHRVRALMDEVFGDENFVAAIPFKKTTGAGSPTGGTDTLASVVDYIVWFAKHAPSVKYRRLYRSKEAGGEGGGQYSYVQEESGVRRRAAKEELATLADGVRAFRADQLTSQSSGGPQFFPFTLDGREFAPGKSGWKTTVTGMRRLIQAHRIIAVGNTPSYVRFIDDFPAIPLNNTWDDTVTSGFGAEKVYVVQTNTRVVERCVLMSSDPGDLVLDPTCGSGTTAHVAEDLGRRWITIDTSRVALALARARIMGSKYAYYLLADSRDGQIKEAEINRTVPSSHPVRGSIRHGFVCERVPHIMLSSIANNAEIDVVWDTWQKKLEPLRESLNAALKKNWQEWEIPREVDAKWPDAAKKLHAEWWKARIARQKEIDASIAAKAEYEYLYDKPYEDKKKVRVAGPFTVESLSPHRVLGVDENDELIDGASEKEGNDWGEKQTFPQMILENLKTAGVQQAHKADKITFASLVPWPGRYICAEGHYLEGETKRRAGIFIGPEFGTVSRPDLVEALREAGDADFDVLIACAFNYDGHATDLNKLGRIPLLKARMNADLHMADDLKNTGKGNLFVIFGEPDIDLLPSGDEWQVKVNGVDVFDPSTGEVRSDGADGIACWFIDTDYNGESFFVRHAYFLGQNDPYSALKTTLKAEINQEAWDTLHSDTSRPFAKPKTGRIAVKVINHLGDEVMKVFQDLAMVPSARDVFDDPLKHWGFLTVARDVDFEGQHFDRKQAGQATNTRSEIKAKLATLRDHVTASVSAFANTNNEGGLLVVGIASDGTVPGVDHLQETDKNSLVDFATFLHHQAAEARYYRRPDGLAATICLIFVPCSVNGICETATRTPKAWIRQGPQNLPLTQDLRDRLRESKRFVDFELTPCCPYVPGDLTAEIVQEFRRGFRADGAPTLTDDRLLYEAGALVRRGGDLWLTYAGLLFFATNPQRVLPRSFIRVLRFGVHSSQFAERGLPTFDRQFTGPLTKQIRDARTFFRESAFFKRYQRRNPDGAFIEEPELPGSAVDEALVNAVAHREYRTGIPIECEAYVDAFIIKNPGRLLQRNTDLPDSFSLADRTLDSMPRNPRLLEWLKLIRDPTGAAYVQAISEGTKQMLSAMSTLSLPPPAFHLAENETRLHLESRATEREAALLATTPGPSSEFGNLFSVRMQRGQSLVAHPAASARYREFLGTLRDKLVATGWFLDRFSFSRIVTHRKGIELEAPENVRKLLRFYPAYEIQLREYFDRFYLCVDFKVEVLNIQTLATFARTTPVSRFSNVRCMAKKDEWREGRILDADATVATIHFFDTDERLAVPIDAVVPNCGVAMLEESLRTAGVAFDLSTALKRHSLASKAGAARSRFERIQGIVRHFADTIFPLQVGDITANLAVDPVQLVDQPPVSENALLVSRLPEPAVEFRSQLATTDVRSGITQFGAYDVTEHTIQIVPVCLHSARRRMEELIERLKTGRYKYRGSERTFATRLSHQGVITVGADDEIPQEINRVLAQHSEWAGDPSLKRIFLVQAPEVGHSLDDHTSPYYMSKRFLFERGLPCQMVDTPTLDDPDWKDLNLALNITAKCGVTPWVLPDAIPEADFFVGLSYTQSLDGQRIMGFANVFNSYGKWEFYSGNTSAFGGEAPGPHLARLVHETLEKVQGLTPAPRIVFHHSFKVSRADRDTILAAARKVRPEGIFVFAWINSHHGVRWYDNRPETDGSLRRGSYVVAAKNRIYLSTTGYNPFRRALGTPKPLEITVTTIGPGGQMVQAPDLRVLAVQGLNLTKLNWASTDAFCGEPITLKYANDIAYLTAAFLRQSEQFVLHPVLERTPWFI